MSYGVPRAGPNDDGNESESSITMAILANAEESEGLGQAVPSEPFVDSPRGIPSFDLWFKSVPLG